MTCAWSECSNELTAEQVRRGIRFCTRRCGNRRVCKYPPRSCSVCGIRLTRKQLQHGNKTCGYECGGKLQRTMPLAKRLARSRNGNLARAKKILQRHLRQMIADLPCLVQLPERHRREVIRWMWGRERRAYARGYQACFAQRRRRRQRRALVA